MAVSLHVTAPTGRPNGARYSGQTAWRGPGDLVEAADGSGFTESRASLAYVAAVEVEAAEPEGAVVVFGDSKSDGGLAIDADSEQRWTDVLHARLVGDGRLGVAVANVSFMGATLLPADDPTSGLARFDADVLSRAGVRTVIIALGTNDLLWRTTDEIVGALTELVERGHDAGLRVVGATMPPFAGPRADERCPVTDPPGMRREGTRLEVNGRIRGELEPAVGFDAVVDLDAALRDPDDRTRIACPFSDYGLSHPNPVGHAAMARAVDLDALLP
jgi:lysophospholipase L1-like esterase